MTWLEYALLLTAAAFGGALNSVAGGGSFLTFPALLLVGLAPITANATNAVALWPGSLAAAIAYRRELPQDRRWFLGLLAIGSGGGVLGALLLLRTSNAAFSRLVPFLLLLAALVFTFGPSLNARLRSLGSSRITRRLQGVAGALLLFAIAIYGGYFGGGMGMLLLATFSLLGMTNMHAMNALKNALATLINFVAVCIFVWRGRVLLGPGLSMVVAAPVGGYAGAAFARRLPAPLVRRFVLVVAWSMTAYFFVKAA
jgi:uncharacterized membrane protein YfcA